MINAGYGPLKMQKQMESEFEVHQVRYLANLPTDQLLANFGPFRYCIKFPKDNCLLG